MQILVRKKLDGFQKSTSFSCSAVDRRDSKVTPFLTILFFFLLYLDSIWSTLKTQHDLQFCWETTFCFVFVNRWVSDYLSYHVNTVNSLVACFENHEKDKEKWKSHSWYSKNFFLFCYQMLFLWSIWQSSCWTIMKFVFL